MRYGKPAIAEVIGRMAADGVEKALLIPQYPHYAMSSWETVVARVYAEAARRAPGLRLDCLQPFFADEDYIEALVSVSAADLAEPHDHLLFSYHGIPVRHLRQADSSRAHCLKVPDCCATASPIHATCYRAQVFATTRAFAARARLDPRRHSVSFQSRLAGEPWLEPFTDAELKRLPSAGVRRLLVICPAFVADCLETLEEIAVVGRRTFLAAGGEGFKQIPCLNDQAPFIEFLSKRADRWLAAGAP
jgi:ferrochelatase